VTPFDAIALLVMLRAFYPAVSVAQLQRARVERPEYFAAGRLGGSKGEKLFLADGRVFDLILAAGGPASGQRWQVLDVTNDVGAGDDPFALEEGPLAFLDAFQEVPPIAADKFQSLVAGELAAFGASDDVLHMAGVAIAEFDGPLDLETASTELLGPAEEHHAAMREALDLDDPAEELEAAGLTRNTIDASLTEFDEDAPADVDEPDPGPPPTHGGEDDPPPTEEPQA
jgi:hypothetical protein